MDADAVIAYFISWENHSRDTIDFKKIYVDMADDLVSGLVLSQIIYWHLPGESGVTRLRVDKDGYKWIAKKREDWWKEIRVSAKQLDRALDILEEKGLVVTGLYGFAGVPTKHVRLNWDGFLSVWQARILPKGQNVDTAFLPKGEMDFDQRSNSNTENTTETTINPPSAESDKALSKAARMAARRTENAPALGQTDEERESTKAQPQSKLETYLAQAKNLSKTTLPFKLAQKLLETPRTKLSHVTFETAAQRWLSSPLYRKFVDEKIEYWRLNSKDHQLEYLVNLVCMIDGDFGWYEYLCASENDAGQPIEDERDIPGSPF